VRVKFFGFRVAVRGRGFLGGAPRVLNGAEIEDAINGWLADHPGVRVVDVCQTATGASGLGSQFLYLTVWYEEPA
jgi:hypothetical protein